MLRDEGVTGRDLIASDVGFVRPSMKAPLQPRPEFRESLFAGIDAAFADIVPAKWTSRANSPRQLKLFQDVRAALSGDVSRPIYSQELARYLGVSVRNMHDAV